MPMIRIPNALRHYVDKQAEVFVDGDTVSAVMEKLIQSYPQFQPHLYTKDGALRNFVNLYLNGKNVKYLDGLSTQLKPDDILQLVPSVAGG